MLPCLQVRGHGAAHHPAAHRQRLAAQPPLAHAGEWRQWGGGTLGNMVVGWVAQQCKASQWKHTRWERGGIPSNARRYAIQTGLPTPPARHLPLPAGRRLHFRLRRCYGDGGDWQVGLSGAAVRRWSHAPAGPAAAHTKAGLPQASSQLCPMTRAPHLQHTTHSHCSLAVSSHIHACTRSCMCACPATYPLHLPFGRIAGEVHSPKTCCFSNPPSLFLPVA